MICWITTAIICYTFYRYFLDMKTTGELFPCSFFFHLQDSGYIIMSLFIVTVSFISTAYLQTSLDKPNKFHESVTYAVFNDSKEKMIQHLHSGTVHWCYKSKREKIRKTPVSHINRLLIRTCNIMTEKKSRTNCIQKSWSTLFEMHRSSIVMNVT